MIDELKFPVKEVDIQKINQWNFQFSVIPLHKYQKIGIGKYFF